MSSRQLLMSIDPADRPAGVEPLDLADLGLEIDLDDLSDHMTMTGTRERQRERTWKQENHHASRSPVPDTDNKEVTQKELEAVAKAIRNAPSPSDQALLDVLLPHDKKSTTNTPKAVSNMEKLARVVLDDWNDLIPLLTGSVIISYEAFLCSLNSIVEVMVMRNSKQFNEMLKSITQCYHDIRALHEGSLEQHNVYLAQLQDTAKQLNRLHSNISNAAASVDILLFKATKLQIVTWREQSQ